MELSNNLENKAKFFALYYGQKVLCIRKNESPLLYVGFDDLQNNKVREDDYLELTPISQITDEHAIEVEKIVYPSDKTLWTAKNGREYLAYKPNVDCMLLSVGDFLRSKGYYIGDGTEITFGWVKLKE